MPGEVGHTFSYKECEEVFGFISENLEDEFCDFQPFNGTNSPTKKFLDLDFADFNKVFSVCDLISSEKSFSEENTNLEEKGCQDSSMDDSGYKTTKNFDSHESYKFSTKSETQTEITNSRYGTKCKLSQKDEALFRKRPKWQPSMASQIKRNTSKSAKYLKAESNNETCENGVKIFFERIEKIMIKEEEAFMEQKIKTLVSSTLESLLSEEKQFFKCSNMAHLFIIEKTFELLRESRVRKPKCREVGTYLIQHLCESPTIYKKVIDSLLEKIETIKIDYRPNIHSLYEQQFLTHLLEIAVSKYRKMENCSMTENPEEESYYNYKRMRKI